MKREDMKTGMDYLLYLYELEKVVQKYLRSRPGSNEVMDAYDKMCELVGVQPEETIDHNNDEE